jgi:probable rRNA maturation factor
MKLKIANKNKAKIPAFDFDAIKDTILGKDYQLTLIIANSQTIRKYNTIYRNMDKSTDILSFPYSKDEGEIYICPSETKKAAVKFKRNYDNFFIYLFIHGCTHLKGYDHSDTMDRVEEKFRKEFGI